MWFAYAPLAVKTDYPRLESFEVYGSAMPECIFCGFACYSGWFLLFCHKNKSTNVDGLAYRIGPMLTSENSFSTHYGAY